ncbi:DeoR/GlpR transcriptional regulator [candidate division KSB1 bacterium]|nr:DeoR/GlpR transcriptional regulator [candidate division KSB1 bacterium]
MNKQARKKFILQYIDKKCLINIDDIVGRCNISPITARRDLDELANSGYLIRTHGGAMKDESVSHLFSFARRMDSKREKKSAISKFAAQSINDGDTIFLDCGSTVFNICSFIGQKKSLKVITNSISISSELLKFPEIKVVMIGGEILPERRAAYGPTACKQINQYHADKAFIGTDGISLKDGLSSYDDYEAQIVLAMAEASDITWLLCDASKLETNSVFKFAPITFPDYIITDAEADQDIIDTYKSNNINIIVV